MSAEHRILRRRAGYLMAALTAAACIGASRALSGVHSFTHIVLLILPAVAGAVVGGLYPGIAGALLCAVCTQWTPLGGSPLTRIEVLAVDMLAVAALHGLRKTRVHGRDYRFLNALIRAVLEADSTGIVVLSRSGRILYASRSAERICGPDLKEGRSLVSPNGVHLATPDGQRIGMIDLIIGIEDSRPGAAKRREQAASRDLLIVRPDELRKWVECRIMPIFTRGRTASAVVLMIWDQADARNRKLDSDQEEIMRRSREEREEMFQRIGQQLRGSLDPVHIQSIAAEELGRALRADRCFFLLFHVGDRSALMGPQWCAPKVTRRIEEFEPVALDIDRLYKSGITRISHDMRASSLPSGIVEAFEEMGVRAAINVPVYDGDIATGALVVAMDDEPRAWNSAEVSLAEEVASQVRFVIEAGRLLAAERARAEREQTSSRIGAALRSTIDPETIQREATHAVGKALQVDRCYYIQYDLETHTAAVGPDFVRRTDLLTLTGTYELPGDMALIEDIASTHPTLVVENYGPEDRLQSAALVTLKSEPVRAFIRVPIYADKTPAGALVAAMVESPRDWTADEVGLVESVAAQTCSAIGNAHMILRERALAERQQLLGELTISIGDAASANDAVRVAMRLVGLRLRADRCYLAHINRPREIAEIAGQYCRAGLEPLSATSDLTDPDLRWLMDSVGAGEVLVASDIQRLMTEQARQTATSMLRDTGHRAMIAVPRLMGGRVESFLVLAMIDQDRDWTKEEAALAQEAALRMQAALQPVATHEREHRVASTLQEALLPRVMKNLPGLEVDAHYRAALEEASVGGDFYDAFRLGDCRTAICVGDVSGKGLDAAAQLSTLRNMLRALLYRPSTGSVASVASELNKTLMQHQLLNGFATLFVGVYDEQLRRLSYVSSGQEPAILLRAGGGSPRILGPTAPALGVFESEEFAEASITLGAADLLLLYTDGVSEVGKGGRGMLGVDGVAGLFEDTVAECAQAGSGVGSIKEGLARRIAEHAQAVFRDDLCFLVARAD